MAGGGLAIATFWYANPKLGKEFIQKNFTAQELALSRDHVANYLIPKEGVRYLESHLERYVNLRTGVVASFNTVVR